MSQVKRQNSKVLTSDGYSAYKKYLALKAHFTREHYDYFKYHGVIKTSPDAFAKRKDAYFFHKLSKFIDYENFLLANFVEGNATVWIGNLVQDQEYKDCFIGWKKFNASLGYSVTRELDRLQEENSCEFRDLLVADNNQHAIIIKEYLGSNCRIETIILLDRYLKLFEYWQKFLDDPIIRDINKLASKYRGFIQSNNDQIKKYILANTNK